MANKISVILDVATEKAVAGLKGFRQSVAEADGAFGKVKAGSASAFDSIKQNAGLAGVAVVGAVGTMAAKSIQAASRLGESVNAVNVTFGQSAEGIKALGEEAAESVGLSNAAFNSLAVQFSSFAETISGEGGDVVGTIDEMTTRVADFASVMNIDVADAAAIFQSTLAGESESIRRYGKDISAARVETFAYANGIAKVGEKLTEGQKVQARYALLMQETADVADDFANTSDSLANSQRILAGKLEDTAAKVGKDLAPALAAVTVVLSDLVPVAGKVAVGIGKAFTEMTDQAYQFGQGIADMVDALPFVDLKDPIAETLYEQEKLARGTADLVAEYAKGKPTMEQFAASLEGQGLSQHAINLAIIEYRKQLDGVNDSTGAAVEVTDELTEAIDLGAAAAEFITDVNAKYAEQVAAVKEAEEKATAAREESTRITEENTKALEDQTTATDDLYSAKTQLVGGDIAVRDAQRGAAEAVAALNTLTKKGKVDTDEFKVAQDGAAAALLAAAQAAADYKIDQAEANGETLSGESKTNIYKQKLQELASTLASGSPLRAQLQGYIDQLASIKPEYNTRLNLHITGATVTAGGDFIGVPGGARAAGGPVSAGRTYLVGEEGPELLTMGGNGHVTPNDALGGGLSVTVAPGGIVLTGSRLTPDDVVKALSDFVRRNGPGPIRKLTGV